VEVGELRPGFVVPDGLEGDDSNGDEVSGVDEGHLPPHPLPAGVDVRRVGSLLFLRPARAGVQVGNLLWVDIGLTEELLETLTGWTDEGFTCCRFGTPRSLTEDGDVRVQVAMPRDGGSADVERTRLTGSEGVSEGEESGGVSHQMLR
jgi:hypothetical protein